MRNLHSTLTPFLFIIGLAILTSCGQLSSFQTGKTLGKGETTLGASVLGYGVTDPDANGGDIGAGVFPYAEFYGNYGVGEAVDLGLKVSTGGNLQLSGKYQFVGDAESAFAAAIGGGFELQASNFSENVVFRTHLPLYLSYHPSSEDAVYLTPRWAYQVVTNDNNSNFLGGSLGYAREFSPKVTGMLEGSYYLPSTQNSTTSAQVYQFGVGVAFHLGR